MKATLASVGTSVVLVVFGTQLPGSAAAELLLTVSGSNIGDDVLRTIDSTDGSTVDASVVITLAGHTVRKATGLARHPQTGVLYALLRLEAPIQFPALVTLDEVTGVATSIGNTADDFAGIAFGADGTERTYNRRRIKQQAGKCTTESRKCTESVWHSAQ